MKTTHQSDPVDLTYEEQATWGTCPVCGALAGEWCRAEVGIHLGQTVAGPLKTGQGVHYARLQFAPKTKRLVYE